MKIVRPIVLLATFVLASVQAETASAPSAGDPIPLNVALLRGALTRVNENDAKAAIVTLARRIGQNVGYDIAPHVEVFETRSELKQALDARRVQILMIGLWDLLAMETPSDLEIAYVSVAGGQTSARWLLLTRTDRPLRTFADLRGQSVLVLHNVTSHLGEPWAETRLLELGHVEPSAFFARYQRVDKASAAVLPVFFGRADACIVDEVSFDTLRTLNPQVGRLIAPIETTEPLLNPVICLTHDGWASAQFRRDAYREFGRLSDEPAGRQLLTLFKLDRLVPFQAEQLDTVRVLFQRHERARVALGQP